MENTKNEKNIFQGFADKVSPVFEGIARVFGSIGDFFKVIWSYFWSMRKIIMAIPVIVESVRLAQYNRMNLPEAVGINLLASGEYAQVISRDAAILGPIAVTGFCLILMFCSRRTLYPWLISLFSLVLPILILVINLYPM